MKFLSQRNRKAPLGLRRRRGIGIVEVAFTALGSLVLAAVLVPKYQAVVRQAETSSTQETMHVIAVLASSYFAEAGYYPGGTIAGTVVTYAATTATAANFTAPSGKAYLTFTPVDPSDKSRSVAFPFVGSSDANGNDSFTIQTPAAHDNATLSALPGWVVTTSKHIQYSSDSGFSAIP